MRFLITIITSPTQVNLEHITRPNVVGQAQCRDSRREYIGIQWQPVFSSHRSALNKIAIENHEKLFCGIFTFYTRHNYSTFLVPSLALAANLNASVSFVLMADFGMQASPG
ncbi:hypothetical protein DdX_17026 [Ditylenchus destructor]|uniref:Uncharacterized protein n=1 Tax=Ditylenchus destructor TaxID=166010 RepID=A0AAD4QZD4_9BILA|nr:hypothetical protein DdX_17026 [Ditylenchus destructor]